eukprot:CAMPEP_0114672616 /NCGR_PEP_ID=MMETSP0191-20121206/43224_1 /TAXON_ID=126664 /ORGANISM="Sorites sp." /LENGTH=796 /DNA_ID=CAMNT_0001935413 /DNA_START=81 /DNA_END=2471 /DNA_ORIENTATION=+
MISLILVIAFLFGYTNGACDLSTIATALQCAVDNGGDVGKLSSFIKDAAFYVNNDNLTDLQEDSLLASNVLKLYPDAFFYYPTYLNTKMVMYFDQINRGDVTQFVKYAVEVMFPNNGFNSTGAQALIGDLIDDKIPSSYNTSDGREVIQLIIDYVDIPSGIGDILFWLYDNDELAESDPNTYFKYLLNGLLDKFVLPDDVEKFGRFVYDSVTIPKDGTAEEFRTMIRQFLGSEYIPDSISDMVDEITLNEKNFMQMETEASGAVIAALEWKLFENDMANQFAGTQWSDEFSWTQKLISNYLLANFTQILYINEDGATDYLFYQINAYLNTTNIRDGWKDLYTILLKLPMNNADEESIFDELETFFSTTDIIDNNLRITLDELFKLIANETRGDTYFVDDLQAYIESFTLSPITQSWYNENMKDIETMQELGNVLEGGFEEIQGFILLIIDIMDKDDVTFGELSGPFWPNNLVSNLNRIASNVKYLNGTKKMLRKFTEAVFLSVTDMYEFEYPYNALLNITSQVLPLIVDNGDYYFESDTNGNNKADEFLTDVFSIVENTLMVTANGKDLIDIIQLYVETYKLEDNDFDHIVTFICDQNKDIAKDLCSVFEMVNATVSLINEFDEETRNFTYPDSINDIKNTLDIPEFLPFISKFIDATVSTFYPTQGAKIVAVIDTTYAYWKASTPGANEIVDLIDAIGDLYLTGNSDLENTWDKTIIYAEHVLSNAQTELGGKTTDEIDTLIDGYTNNINTPAPTTAKVQTFSPTPSLIVEVASANNYYKNAMMVFIVLITFFMY